jgi:hypothetical protein
MTEAFISAIIGGSTPRLCDSIFTALILQCLALILQRRALSHLAGQLMAEQEDNEDQMILFHGK